MKNIPYYLPGFLFAVLAPIYVYIAYPDIQMFARPDSIWRFVLIFFAFFAFMGLASFILVREHLAAGLISSCLILGILYPLDPFLFIVSTILLTSILLAIVRKRFDLMDPFVASTVISIVIVIYIGVEYTSVSQSLDPYKKRSMTNSVEIKVSSSENKNKPDVYYIILDAYGGEAMLKELHGFDNSTFTSALRKRGFFLPPASRPNYLRTIHSLSSSLNMQYLDDMSKTMGNSSLWWPLKDTFANNETRKFLESQGYKTVTVASGWGLTTITDVDEYRQPYPIFLNEFEEFFIGHTNLSLFSFLEDLGVSFPSYDTHRQIVLYGFEQLKNIAELDSPKFTFVHIVSPHPPFIFDAEGNPIYPDYLFTLADNRFLITPPSKYQKGYLDQLSFVNNQVLEVVDTILEKSITPPIIIIQGDHGPGIFIDSQSSAPPCFYERFSILNAYYLPGIDPGTIPQDITPVNTFRMIFNFYFSADLEFLPNHQYFSPPETIYQFEAVTDRIDDSCKFPNNN
jgi:hypothetical protein